MALFGCHKRLTLLVIAQPDGPDHSGICHEDHGRCIRDSQFQNCSDRTFAPSISHTDLLNVSVTVHGSAKFKCVQEKYHATVALLQFDWIKWSKDESVYSALDIDYGNFTTIVAHNNSRYTIKPTTEDGKDVSYLTIHSVTLDDTGLYSCVVCNQYGRDYSTAYLTLNATPSPVFPTKVTSWSSVSTMDSVSGSLKLSELTRVILGCIGGFIGLLVMLVMFFFVRKKIELKRQGLPMILQETNFINELQEGTSHVEVKQENGQSATSQRDSLVAQVRKRNSSYRSQLSSAASAGTVITYAEDLFEYPLDEKWEVPRESIEIKELAGEGAFGYVAKAEAFQLPNMLTPCTVAVKMLKENASDVELADLISEMETMKEIGTHKNIVNFLGACTVQGPLYLIVEYCPHGNLRDLLRNSRPSLVELTEDIGAPLTFRDLLSTAYQIARGMSYLSSKKCIHRDLAARNVLIADDFVIKIADFGLSRNLGNMDYYRKTTHGRLPVKWLAVEALFDQQYTVKTDVWSFGILLWEIFTLGGTPYPGIPVEELFTLLKNGYRMECPINCPPKIYEVMLQCWSDIAKHRPSFSELYKKLDEMLSSETAQEYIAILAQSVDCLADVDVEPDEEPERSKLQAGRVNTTV